MPFAVKDNIDVAGVPTTAACPDFINVPAEHARAVQPLFDAGKCYWRLEQHCGLRCAHRSCCSACAVRARVPSLPTPCLPFLPLLLPLPGGIFVGKTNLDQFACGLVGTRTPYGIPGACADSRGGCW